MVVHLWALYGIVMRRTAQVKGTPDSADVEADPEIQKFAQEINDVLHQEVKFCEALSLYKAVEQCERDMGFMQDFAIFHKRKGRRWVVIVDAHFFIRMFIVYFNFRRTMSLQGLASRTKQIKRLIRKKT